MHQRIEKEHPIEIAKLSFPRQDRILGFLKGASGSIEPHTLRAAGMDSGAEAHCVAVPPSDDPQPGRSFGAYRADVEAWADWLAPCGITTVALASTGVYGIPLFELLETRGCAVLLVDPQPGQQIRGRPQSDVDDGQWIQRLHTFGLLASALRPADH